MNALLSLTDIIERANKYLDEEVMIVPDGTKPDNYCDSIANPTGNGYSSIIEVIVCDRFAQIKIRDPELLVEYQLCMTPWSNGFRLNHWYDGDGKRPWKNNRDLSINYSLCEEEYFQLSTIRNFEYFKLSDVSKVKELQDRIFNYFEIIPDESEY